jgi:hypothetical protein
VKTPFDVNTLRGYDKQQNKKKPLSKFFLSPPISRQKRTCRKYSPQALSIQEYLFRRAKKGQDADDQRYGRNTVVEQEVVTVGDRVSGRHNLLQQVERDYLGVDLSELRNGRLLGLGVVRLVVLSASRAGLVVIVQEELAVVRIESLLSLVVIVQENAAVVAIGELLDLVVMVQAGTLHV